MPTTVCFFAPKYDHSCKIGIKQPSWSHLFQTVCQKKELDPSKTVFVFPGSQKNHRSNVTFYSVKSGEGGLADMANCLVHQNYPTLSLPVFRMMSETSHGGLPIQSIATLYYALGKNFSLLVPVRPYKPTDNPFFSQPLQGTSYEPDFWELDQRPNLKLADFYTQALDELRDFSRLSEEEKVRVAMQWTSSPTYNNTCLLGHAYLCGHYETKASEQGKPSPLEQPHPPLCYAKDSLEANDRYQHKMHVAIWVLEKKIPPFVMNGLSATYGKYYEQGKLFFEINRASIDRQCLNGGLLILKDYLKGNAWGRFFSGHWNRHHAAEVKAIIQDIEKGHIQTPFMLVTRLLAINPKNKVGSFAKRRSFILSEFSHDLK